MTIVSEYSNSRNVTVRELARQNGADQYLQAMWEEAQDTGAAVDWAQVDELYADALAVDACQTERTDWRA